MKPSLWHFIFSKRECGRWVLLIYPSKTTGIEQMQISDTFIMQYPKLRYPAEISSWSQKLPKSSSPWSLQCSPCGGCMRICRALPPQRAPPKQLRKPWGGSRSGEEVNGDKRRPPDHKPWPDQPRLGCLAEGVWCWKTWNTEWPQVTLLMMCSGVHQKMNFLRITNGQNTLNSILIQEYTCCIYTHITLALRTAHYIVNKYVEIIIGTNAFQKLTLKYNGSCYISVFLLYCNIPTRFTHLMLHSHASQTSLGKLPGTLSNCQFISLHICDFITQFWGKYF